jgi:hypothetical protein
VRSDFDQTVSKLACARHGFLIRMRRYKKYQVEAVIHTVRTVFRNFRSTCSVGIVSLFVLFLAASAPHRVHHLFENLRKTHVRDHHIHPSTQSGARGHTHGDAHSAGPLHADTTHDDQNHDGTTQTICLLQGAAQHSHLSAAQPVSIIFLKVEFEERLDRLLLLLSPFNPSPFSQRAPPKV